MGKVIYSPRADADLFNIATSIAQDKPDAALHWLKSIRETCNLLATQTQMGEVRLGYGVPNCRSFSVGNYVIFFRPAEEGIEVARIVHGSRDLRNLR